MHRQHKYRKRWSPFLFVPLVLVVIALLSWVVMLLWNATVSPLFELPEIKFWQALALFVLCRLLFGRLGPPAAFQKGGQKRTAWKEKWRNMSEEDRAIFKARWKERCGKRGE